MPDQQADTIIVGGGTAGCVLAARLTEDPAHRVLLLEAGPDYGPRDEGRWPWKIDNAWFIEPEVEHDWGYRAPLSGRDAAYLRGKVLGGSSAINATGLNWGQPSDYDRWRDLGNPGWDFAGLLPFFHRVERLLDRAGADPQRGTEGMLPVTRSTRDNAFCNAYEISLRDTGMTPIDASGPAASAGFGTSTRNAVDGKRWSAAFAYVDPVRGRPNLEIRAGAEVVRLLWQEGQVTGVVLDGGNGEVVLSGGRVVLAAGAIGSPLLLQRSGIGPESLLRGLLPPGTPIHHLSGVGQNLQDHYGARFAFSPGPALLANPGQPGGLVVRFPAKPGQDTYTLDLSLGWRPDPSTGESRLAGAAFLVEPEARGSVVIGGPDPEDPPVIDFGFGVDGDVEQIARGIEWVRERMRHPALAGMVGDEIVPGAGVTGAELRCWVRDHLSFYYHASCTCAMGPDPRAGAVVDAHGRVHGFGNLFVADASVMPAVPHGMPVLTIYAVAEKIAAGLRSGGG